MAYPELVQLKARVESLEAELKEAWREVNELRQRACGTVPVAEVHAQLNRLGVPLEIAGRHLFLAERFTFVEQFLTGRRQKKGAGEQPDL